MPNQSYFKVSAVSLSISIMLLAAGFFGFSSFTCATSPFILDIIRASITQPFNGLKFPPCNSKFLAPPSNEGLGTTASAEKIDFCILLLLSSREQSLFLFLI